MWSSRQAIEIFHLLFLRALRERVEPGLYCLKGGCNLRFYCKSIRYSEDIDLDVHTVALGTLRKNVETTLRSDAFVRTLRAQEILVGDFSAPKQTPTTQRWKVKIRNKGATENIPTKIEFSRRRFDPETLLQPVDAEIIARYKLYPVLVQHYSPSTALMHKVEALALRNETQARDVFDLKLLFDASVRAELPAAARKLIPEAVVKAIGIGFDDFSGQVVAYLEPEYQQYYRDRGVWERLQEDVVTRLEALAS
jgi:predicted nucleotidyltransferase component of viral defense system